MHKWQLLMVPLLLCGAALRAAPPGGEGGSISFSQAREIILSKNAGLKSAGTETEAAKAGLSQARALPNPGVGLALEKFGANEFEASVEQTIELGGKRRLRTEAAQKEVDAAQNTRNLTQLELEAEIVRRFIPIATSERKLALLDSIIAISEAIKDQIQKRVNAGAARKTDLVRAEIEIEQLNLERSELVRENEQARKKFAALGAEQDLVLLSVSGSITNDAQIPSLEELRKALGNNPQLKAVDIEQARLDTQRKQLRAEIVPDLNLSAGYLQNNIENAYSPLVGLSMNIPLFNKNTAAQKQVELQRQALGQRRENTVRLLDADIQELHSRLLEIDKKIAVLSGSTIPKSESVYSMMQEYYQAGSAGFLDLSATQAEMLRLRMDLYDIQTERAQNLADLMQTTSLNIDIVK